MRRVLLIAAVGLCIAGVAPSGTAAAVTPLEYTRQTLERTREIVDSNASHNEKLKQLSALLSAFLDTDAMGKAALANNWSKFTPDQQREFLTLFRELFQRTYVQKILLFERPNFAYVGEEVDGRQARVDTKILTPRDEFAVVYQMRADGSRWLATDIKIEDLSLTQNFRSQLAHLLASSTPEDVLERMRRKYGPQGRGEDSGQ